MSISNDFPVLDGIAPSWADISVKLLGADITLLDVRDIAAINTSRTVEVGEQRSPAGLVLKTTTGSLSQEASWTLYRAGYQKMLRTLMQAAIAQGKVRGNEVLISLVHFQIDMQWTPIGDSEIYQRILKGVRVLTDAVNGAEGVDADQVEVGLNVKKIVDVIDGREVVLL